MIEVRAALPEDLQGFELDARQAQVLTAWADTIETLIEKGSALAVLHHGRVVAFAGLTWIWPGRSAAWCFLGRDIPVAAWLPMTRVAREVLEKARLGRVEADICAGFQPAVRWARMLGFSEEGAMPNFWQGETYLRFARIAA